MTLHPALILLGGLVILLLGAELVLRGAARLAAMLGLRPMLIGLTVVAVGTSAPELAVGLTAVVEDRGPMAVGNIAGTNMFNLLFILGLSAVLRPLPLQLLSLRLDVPVMIVAAVALLAMAWDGNLSRVEGFVLLGLAAVYLVALVRLSRRESAAMRREFAEEYSPKVLGAGHGLARGAWHATLLVVGLGLTLLGADFLVAGAVELARRFGVSDPIIGLTILAVGTSAPELATTIVATVKDDRDVAVGNLIGSCIINVVVILGLTCVAAPQGIDVSRDVLWIDLPLSAAVAIACWPVFRSDRQVSRREGAAFVAVYLVYMAILIFVRA